MSSGTEDARRIGRPRDARADRAILEVTLDLIAELGVHGFRTEDVAVRAGVGKGAIYRRYRSKDELVAAATAALVSEEIPVPDAGSTRADLLALMEEAVALYRNSRAGRLMPNLVGAMAHNPGLARAVREGFLTGRRAALAEVLRRGVDRGDLRADLDLELALDVLGGPLFYRLLITGGPTRREARRRRRRPDPARLRTGAPPSREVPQPTRGEGAVKIHAIQTGTVAVTSAWREGVGHGRRRLVHTILDRQWTEPLPIYAFAIEHPEGVIVVDTGETAQAPQPGYFPRWHPGVRAFREWVEPGEEIGPQLDRLGIRPADVRWVVMTHLHTDHAGGLHHFPRNEILVTRAELEFASGLPRAPAWLRREYALAGHVRARPRSNSSQTPFGPFPRSLRLTDAGDVTLVPLPGHTPGQVGVLVADGDHTVFLAGDSSYTQDLMLRGKADGVGASDEEERRTHERIRDFAAATPTVYLVAHDPDTASAARRAAARASDAAGVPRRDLVRDGRQDRQARRGGLRLRL